MIGGAQGGAQGGASGGGRAIFSGDEAASRWVEEKKPVIVSTEDVNMKESIYPTCKTFCGVGGVGIAVLQLSGPLWHQWWGRWVLRVWQGIAEHQRLPRVATLNSSFLFSLTGH